MKRLMMALLAMLAVAVVAGAGYLGMQDAQGKAPPTVQAPTTVQVTRGDVQQTVTAPGRLIGTQQVALSPGFCGRLSDVNVLPGRQVQRGDLLAQFDSAPLEQELSSAQADLELAQARLMQIEAGASAAELAAAKANLLGAEIRLNQLLAGPSPAEIAAAQYEVASARSELARLQSLPQPATVALAKAEFERASVTLQQAQRAYDQVKDRPDVGMLPQALELQKATITFEAANAAFRAASQPATDAELDAAQARLAAARSNLALIQAGPPEEEIRLAEMRKAEAEAALAQLTSAPPVAELKQAQTALRTAQKAVEKVQSDLNAASVTAPFGGIVLEVRAGPGETVCSGEGFIVLSNPDALEVESTVIEEDLPLVQVGQRAELFFDAQPSALISGRVSRIVPQRSPAGDRPLYPVYFALNERPEGLVPGMTADASIIIARQTDVLRLPRTVARARPDGTAQVRVWTGGQIEVRTVKVGMRGDVYVQILEGLHEGEEVLAQ